MVGGVHLLEGVPVASLQLRLSVEGTELPRAGQHPLVAVAVMCGDRLVQATIIDPEAYKAEVQDAGT